MNYKEDFLYKPRHFKSIESWKDVTEKEWYDSKWQLKNIVTTVEELERIIKLTPYQVEELNKTFEELKHSGIRPMRITPYYASLMSYDPFHPEMLPGEKSMKRLDPIFWQCVPTPANLLFPNTGKERAMEETSRSFGIAYQRYPNRVALLVAANTSCASYCVHCQRVKSFEGVIDINLNEINKGLFYVSYNKNIDEVLVTGGDALMISQERLRYILEELSRIPHLRVIRIATRVPVVLPMAITDELLELIKISANKHSNGIEKYVYFMTHINHYHEITKDLADAIKKIREYGFTVRNQTVLLNHVNDYYKTLAETFRRMFWIGVHPYYLLQCHKEKGIAHFITPIQIGKIYIRHLQGWLSGVAKPVYAANVEGGGGKILLMPSGHNTLNTFDSLEDRISESYATVYTWDGREIYQYEALGRASREEFDEAVYIMDKFIGRKGVFLPKIIIVDEDGNHIETTNRSKLPVISNIKKSELLGYELNDVNMPLINPALIENELNELYKNSIYSKYGSSL